MQQLQRAGEASVTEYMQLLESMSDVAGWEAYYNLPIADRPDVSMQGINYWEDQKQVAQQDAQFAAQVEKQEQLEAQLAAAKAAQQAAAGQSAVSSPGPGSHAMDKLRREGEDQGAVASQSAVSSPGPGSHAMDKLRREGAESGISTGVGTQDAYVGNNPVNDANSTWHAAAAPLPIYTPPPPRPPLHVVPPVPPSSPYAGVSWIARGGILTAGVALFLNIFARHAGEGPGMQRLVEGRQYGGHALESHAPWIDDDFLKNRIINEGRRQATRFSDYDSMEAAIASLDLVQADLDAWARTASPDEETIVIYDAERNVGYGFERTPSGVEQIDTQTKQLRYVRIIIRLTGQGGWYVHTAYPSDNKHP